MLVVKVSSFLLAICLTAIQARSVLPGIMRPFSLLPMLLVLVFLARAKDGTLKHIRKYKNFSFSIFVIFAIFTIASLFLSLESDPEKIDYIFNRLAFLVVTFIFSWYVFYETGTYKTLFSRFEPFLWGPLIYIFISVGFYFLGVRFGNNADLRIQETQPAVMLQSMGININRVRFALSEGVNNFSPVAGLALIVSCFVIFLKKNLSIGIPAFLCSLLAIFLADGRAAIVYALLSFFLAWICTRYRSAKFGYLVVFGVMLLPAAFIFGGEFLGTSLSNAGLSRGDGDLGTLNERTAIWGLVWEEFSSFRLQHLIGFGEQGQTSTLSNIGFSLANIYDKKNLYATSMHNTYLQVLVNMGWLGLAVFLTFILSLSRCLSVIGQNHGRCYSYILYSVFFYILLYSNTEVSILIGGQLFLFFWCFAMAICALYRITIYDKNN